MSVLPHTQIQNAQVEWTHQADRCAAAIKKEDIYEKGFSITAGSCNGCYGICRMLERRRQ